ncbi:MAG TPA: caspase family protein [Longimicrobiaceae bacterium]|nr:caspase family protein [Longimicrobiaceae bacterium]
MRRSLAALVGALAGVATPCPGQRVAMEGDLPRAMVFLQEDGSTAATVVTGFLREAGFQVIDPAFARTAAQRERARLALAGDNAAATDLGRDLGAQVIILGSAPSEAGPNPVDRSLQVGTTQLNVRALRLDRSRVVATGSTHGRGVGATPSDARAMAVRNAAEALVYQTGFLGTLANDWERSPWDDGAYWTPEPARPSGPVASLPGPATAGGAPVILLESDAYPTPTGTRGLHVGSGADAAPLRARVRGMVQAADATVRVGGREATVRTPSSEERRRYGLPASGLLFEGEVPLGRGQDTVRVQVRAGGVVAQSLVRPKIRERWAVVVGVSRYADPRIPPLRYADDDARAVYDFLRSPAGGSVPDDHVRLLLDEEATAAAVRDALFVFLQRAGPDDLVFIYVASHGLPDPGRPANLYLLPYDTRADAVAATAFPMWDFKTAMHRQIASDRVVVIADACHSAGTLVDEGANPIGGAFAELINSARRVTMSASAVGEFSHEGPQWGGGHGVFTHLLLEGLAGGADADGDGVVSFAEAADYVEERVPRATQGRQTPQRTGLGDVPLAYVRATGQGRR